jgi:DNA-binding XRE family transcriptional regulator
MSPTPDEIKAARIKAGHTQEVAATLMGKTRRTWIHWENGDHKMPPDTWLMYLIRTGQTLRAPIEAAMRIHDAVNKKPA